MHQRLKNDLILFEINLPDSFLKHAFSFVPSFPKRNALLFEKIGHLGRFLLC